MRIQYGTSRWARPTSSGRPVVGSSTIRQMPESHRIRLAVAGGIGPNQFSQAGSTGGGTPNAANGSPALAGIASPPSTRWAMSGAAVPVS